MHPAVRDDRIWFQNNPTKVVRFRRAVSGEFQAISNQGIEVPCFRPVFCSPQAPTHWVAVVDLMRLLKDGEVEQDEPKARLRLRVPAMRSIDRKRRAERELKQAIAAELLANLGVNSASIAA